MEKEEDWPEDLIIEIQLRLPTKSLLRFRCVSKSWSVRFLNSNFIRSHYLKQKVLDGDNFDNSNIFYLRYNAFYETGYEDYGPFDVFYYFIKFEETNLKIEATENILLPYRKRGVFCGNVKGQCWDVKGHCMGVFCLEDMERLALWNPAIREFKLIDRPKYKNYIGWDSKSNEFIRLLIDQPYKNYMGCDSKNNEFTRSYRGVGFGCDSKTNEFKIVQYVRDSKEIEGEFLYNYSVEIYSFHSEKWKILYHDDDERLLATVGPFHYWNGSCYWSGQQPESPYSKPCYIVSFDMTNETFKITNTDIYVSECKIYSCLECLGGVVSLKYPTVCFDIWKFKDLDDKSSWMKQRVGLEIRCVGDFLSFWKNDEMFMTDKHHELVLYDHATKMFRRFDTCLKTNPANHLSTIIEAFDCFVYVESLVTFGGGRNEYTEGLKRMLLS